MIFQDRAASIFSSWKRKNGAIFSALRGGPYSERGACAFANNGGGLARRLVTSARKAGRVARPTTKKENRVRTAAEAA